MSRSGWARRYAQAVLWWAAFGWPLAAARLWPAVAPMVIWAVIGTPVILVGQDRRWTRLTGWDDQRRTELIRAARRGQLPTDPAERARLHDLVATEAAEFRGGQWIIVAVLILFGGGLFLPGHRLPPPVLAACIIWYCLVAGAVLYLSHLLRDRRQRVLSTVDGSRP